GRADNGGKSLRCLRAMLLRFQPNRFRPGRSERQEAFSSPCGIVALSGRGPTSLSPLTGRASPCRPARCRSRCHGAVRGAFSGEGVRRSASWRWFHSRRVKRSNPRVTREIGGVESQNVRNPVDSHRGDKACVVGFSCDSISGNNSLPLREYSGRVGEERKKSL